MHSTQNTTKECDVWKLQENIWKSEKTWCNPVAQRWCSLIKLSLQSHKSRPTNTYDAHLSDTITNLHTTLYLIFRQLTLALLPWRYSFRKAFLLCFPYVPKFKLKVLGWVFWGRKLFWIRFRKSHDPTQLDQFSSILHDNLDPEAIISIAQTMCGILRVSVFFQFKLSSHLSGRSSESFVYKLDTSPVIFLSILTGLESRKPTRTWSSNYFGTLQVK